MTNLLTSPETCAEKMRFVTKAYAKSFVKRYGYQGQKPYKCNNCVFYHLTSRNRAQA